MPTDLPGAPSRRDVLAAAGCFLLAGRAAALVPPTASKHTVLDLLAASDLKSVRRIIHEVSEHRTDVRLRTPVFSPDGKFVACAGLYTYDGVYDAATGKRVARLGGTRAVAFRPGGGLLVANEVVGGRFDPGVQAVLSELTVGRKKPVQRFTYRLEMPTFSPDGQFFAGRTVPGPYGRHEIQVLALPGGEERGIVPSDDTLFAVLSGGKQVVSGKVPKKYGLPWGVRVWEVKTRKVIAEIDGHLPLAASADGKRIALGGRDRAEAVVCDWAGGTKTAIRHGHAELSAVGLSADGKRLATAGPKAAPVLDETYALPTRKVKQVATVWDVAEAKPTASAEVGDVRLGWLTFSPDGKHLLVGGTEVVMGVSWGRDG